MLARQKSVPVVFQQHSEVDETVYTTDVADDEEEFLVISEYGDVQFWNDEVTSELSELVGSHFNTLQFDGDTEEENG